MTFKPMGEVPAIRGGVTRDSFTSEGFPHGDVLVVGRQAAEESGGVARWNIWQGLGNRDGGGWRSKGTRVEVVWVGRGGRGVGGRAGNLDGGRRLEGGRSNGGGSKGVVGVWGWGGM